MMISLTINLLIFSSSFLSVKCQTISNTIRNPKMIYCTSNILNIHVKRRTNDHTSLMKELDWSSFIFGIFIVFEPRKLKFSETQRAVNCGGKLVRICVVFIPICCAVNFPSFDNAVFNSKIISSFFLSLARKDLTSFWYWSTESVVFTFVWTTIFFV